MGALSALRVQFNCSHDVFIVRSLPGGTTQKQSPQQSAAKSTTCNATWSSQERSSGHGVSKMPRKSPKDSNSASFEALVQAIAAWIDRQSRLSGMQRYRCGLSSALAVSSGETQHAEHHARSRCRSRECSRNTADRSFALAKSGLRSRAALVQSFVWWWCDCCI